MAVTRSGGGRDESEPTDGVHDFGDPTFNTTMVVGLSILKSIGGRFVPLEVRSSRTRPNSEQAGRA